MQTIIQGKEVETTYSVTEVRDEKGVLTKKPKLAKSSKVIKWDNILAPTNERIETNSGSLMFPLYPSFNISENETVQIEGKIYRADINSVIIHTSKVISENEINKTESEAEFKKVIAEYNHSVVDNDSKMKAYCNLNKIDIDTVNIDDLKKVCENKTVERGGLWIEGETGKEYVAYNSLYSAIENATRPTPKVYNT